MGQRSGAEDPAFVAAKRCHNRPHRGDRCASDMFHRHVSALDFHVSNVFFFFKDI